MTIEQYIDFHGDKSMSELPFTEVDSLLLTSLVYLDLEKIMPKDKNEMISLSKISSLFFKKYDEQKRKKMRPSFIPHVISILQLMAHKKRYKDILFYNYVNEVTEVTQFCAITAKLEDHTNYIAFSGTDDSVIGWKEDFQMSYVFPVPAQEKALKYLKNAISIFGPKYRIGGHSKGGNLAMTSYMLSNFLIQHKIIEVYNFDGPGFRKREFESRQFKVMEKKLKMYIPEKSLIGRLFRNSENYEVIKSSSNVFFQHDGTRWIVDDLKFKRGEFSNQSKKLEKRVFEWITGYSDEDRQKIVDTIFSILENGGITELSQLRVSKLQKIYILIKENKDMDKESRKLLLDAIKKLILQKESKKPNRESQEKNSEN